LRVIVAGPTNWRNRERGCELNDCSSQPGRLLAGILSDTKQSVPAAAPYAFWDFLMQMFQQPDRITMMYRQVMKYATCA
jgi:hypothetical protein